MAQAPVMPIFTDALIGDTTHLSVEEFGAYCLLLFATWRNNGVPYPNDDARLARVCRVSYYKWMHTIRPGIAGFFDLSDGTWRQKRLEKEWSRCSNFRAKMRTNGSKGGRPKILKVHNSKEPIGSYQDNQIDKQNESSLNLLPSEDKNLPQSDIEDSKESSQIKPALKPVRRVSVSKSAELRFSEEFDKTFWPRYPITNGKIRAREAWVKARGCGASVEIILAGLERYRANKPDWQNWKHASSWLKDQRWTDGEPVVANGHDDSDDLSAERIEAAVALVKARMRENQGG